MASINQSPFHKNSFCLGHHSFPVANNSAWRANPLWQISGQETILARTMVPLNYAITQMRSDIIHHDPDRADEKMEQVQRVFCCLTWPTAILLSKQIGQDFSSSTDMNHEILHCRHKLCKMWKIRRSITFLYNWFSCQVLWLTTASQHSRRK